MKKTAAILGIIASVVIMASVIFKFLHLIGASFLLVLGLLLLSLFVLPLMGLADSKNKTGLRNRLTSLLGYLCGSLIFLGILFKLMFWAYAGSLLLVGFILLAFVFIPLYTLKSYQTTENKLMAIARSSIIVAVLVLLWGIFVR